jgi:murein DD-endopeptidase MepM/ murein hydrolase activator NlpD
MNNYRSITHALFFSLAFFPHLVQAQGTTPWQHVTIKAHSSLGQIFTQQHISQKDLQSLIKLKDRRITRLVAGKQIAFQRNKQGQLLALEIPISSHQSMRLTRYGKSFKQQIIRRHSNTTIKTAATTVTKKLAVTTPTDKYISGVVRTSLRHATQAAGFTPAMHAQLMQMFESRINLNQDIHRGDRFAVLYEQNAHTNKLVAAKLMTRHQTLYAVRFGYPAHQEAYFTPAGNSVESRYLPYPLRFKRISSHFSYNRFDPVIHAIHPHLGVDFAADSGTPIKAVADGHITFMGKERGYGNSVRVSFDQHHSALYAHMHHFAKNLRLHQFIHKGDIIGYVGSTGWATGPHLHFSFYEDGKPKNWLTVAKNTNTEQHIPRRYWGRFKETAHRLLTKLDVAGRTHLAENSHKTL